MSKKTVTTPATHTARQLADLAALLGLMQSASKLSQELDVLANQVGGSLEKIAERFGVPFDLVHDTYAGQGGSRKAATRRKRTKKAVARG